MVLLQIVMMLANVQRTPNQGHRRTHHFHQCHHHPHQLCCLWLHIPSFLFAPCWLLQLRIHSNVDGSLSITGVPQAGAELVDQAAASLANIDDSPATRTRRQLMAALQSGSNYAASHVATRQGGGAGTNRVAGGTSSGSRVASGVGRLDTVQAGGATRADDVIAGAGATRRGSDVLDDSPARRTRQRLGHASQVGTAGTAPNVVPRWTRSIKSTSSTLRATASK